MTTHIDIYQDMPLLKLVIAFGPGHTSTSVLLPPHATSFFVAPCIWSTYMYEKHMYEKQLCAISIVLVSDNVYFRRFFSTGPTACHWLYEVKIGISESKLIRRRGCLLFDANFAYNVGFINGQATNSRGPAQRCWEELKTNFDAHSNYFNFHSPKSQCSMIHMAATKLCVPTTKTTRIDNSHHPVPQTCRIWKKHVEYSCVNDSFLQNLFFRFATFPEHPMLRQVKFRIIQTSACIAQKKIWMYFRVMAWKQTISYFLLLIT